MIAYLKCLLFVGAMCSCVPCYAQAYFTSSYNLADGLPHPNVYRIFQDRKGFLWFSTDYGLARFDGHAFHKEFNDTGGFLASSILSVSERGDGSKLISATKGCLLRLTDSSLTPLIAPGLDSFISLFAFEQASRIFFVGQSRFTPLRLYEIRNGRLIPHQLKKGNNKEVVCTKAIQAPGEILIATTLGLYRVVNGMPLPLFSESIQEEVVDAIKTRDGEYWIGLKNKVVHFTIDKRVHTTQLGTDQEVNDILDDRRGNLWIATKGRGLLLLKNGKLTDLRHHVALGSTVINDMLEDFQGNIWIATYGEGVYRIGSGSITHFSLSQAAPALYARTLSIIARDKILVGGLGHVFASNHGRIERYPVRLLQPHHFIYFLKVHEGRLLIGTSHALIIKNLTPPFEEKILREGALSVCVDRGNRVWIGGYNYVYNLVGDSLVRDSVSDGIPRRYFALEVDAEGNLLYGSFNTLFIRKSQTGGPRFDTLLHNTSAVHDLLCDRQGRIWIAAENGLTCISGGRIKRYSAPDKLPVNKCLTLEEDKRGILWVGTLHGVSYVNLRTLRIAQFSGIPVDLTLSMQSDSQSRLYVGTGSKLITVQTDDPTLFAKPIPPLYITGVRVNGGAIHNVQKVHLPYSENKLSIRYTAIEYSRPQSVEYRYRLAPTDKEWHLAKSDNIEFSSLASGHYRFMVAARVGDGLWSQETILPIDVATPFWKKKWFVFASITLAAFLLFLSTKYAVTRAERRKAERLAAHSQIVYLKQQALHALINPHFIFNCLNSIQHYLNEHNNEAANAYLADFAHLIRTTLEDAQKAFIPLDRELERIQLYLSFEQLRFGDELEYAIHVAEEITPHAVHIPNMILQPFIENAIWHGILPKRGKGKVDIRFHKDSGRLRILIQDDGVGFGKPDAAPASASGMGVNLTRQRLATLEKLTGQPYKLIIQGRGRQAPRAGVTVEIALPLLSTQDVLRFAKEAGTAVQRADAKSTGGDS